MSDRSAGERAVQAVSEGALLSGHDNKHRDRYDELGALVPRLPQALDPVESAVEVQSAARDNAHALNEVIRVAQEPKRRAPEESRLRRRAPEESLRRAATSQAQAQAGFGRNGTIVPEYNWRSCFGRDALSLAYL